ncbi:NAD(P)-binding domain-containing protein [Gimibacter soli]|uniref:NAD(P)-binding domain-containing protein n=1 Tax=Gimibacter soli TaxID=3024400 RepID=A0AAF0BLL8_9PROT|nr:NAD(P)-binding domain-containing protein [Gimibacter soli]WCL53296.1 NAD(P)-binding domain-containing protein [Gimibacter soli]
MRTTTTIIIGAGQAGLAMSYHLTAQSIDHVVLERGKVANSWRTERWDSLRLLTPNWQSRLPGYEYEGDMPDGYRTMEQTITFLAGYADRIKAPVETDTLVTAVEPTDGGYVVRTNKGDWQCAAVVIASGACNIANVPAMAADLPSDIRSITPMDYRSPAHLPEGGVLIVGASATGVQLASEIQLSGRPVTLAAGEHVRVPRTYRGRDIKWWMEATGILDEGLNEIDDIRRARRLPSLQLIGSPNQETISLNSLQTIGVMIAGRLMGLQDGRAQFSGALANLCAMADLKMNRLLAAIDKWVDEKGMADEVGEAYRLRPTHVPVDPPLMLDLKAAGIQTVLWATGYRPDYSWLKMPVLTPRGELRHNGGVVDAPGLYVLGLPFLRTRKSNFIDGVGNDARHLADHLARYLAGSASVAA